MGVIGEAISLSTNFLYGQAVPSSLHEPLIVLGIYLLHLFISGIILYYAVKVSGGETTLTTGFPKAMFTILIRDLIAIPLIFIAFMLPFIGIIFAVIVWLALIKFMFNIPWLRALLAWIISLIIPIVILVFILIPVALLLLVF